LLVLRPKGRFRVSGRHEVRSRLGWSHLACGWKVVELWTLAAEELLAAGDVGLVPWVPLTHFDGPPEPLLERCRERIEQQAHPDDQANLLAVTQVLAKLRFPQPELLNLLGGKQVMIESPLIKELLAEYGQDSIVEILTARWGGPSQREEATSCRRGPEAAQEADAFRRAMPRSRDFSGAPALIAGPSHSAREPPGRVAGARRTEVSQTGTAQAVGRPKSHD
jgi:hypothetical protein